MNPSVRAWPLFVVVFVIATSGLVYELVAGAIASYLLGDSVTQFSLVIGAYLSSLGVGAYGSKFVERRLARRFVDIEFAAALVGGMSAPLLLVSYAHVSAFPVLLWGTVALTGVLVGLELPLLLRLLHARGSFRDVVAHALFFDYIGALVASVLFALVLVPRLGLIRTSLLGGILNALVGLASTALLPAETPTEMRGARVYGLSIVALLVALFTQADRITNWSETALYSEPILRAQQSPYQRLVVTGEGRRFSLFLNNNLQFSSTDEQRYHEALVHPAFGAIAPETARRVLVAGGGDGLALREILTYPEVLTVTLVDLDPAVTTLAREYDVLRARNANSLADPRVTLRHEDALRYLATTTNTFDVIVADFPDPNNLSLGKLYTTAFYRSVRAHLAPAGALVVQATSPYFSRRSFWCIVTTVEAVGFFAHPYHAFVPSFGEWGFVLARLEPFPVPTTLRRSNLTFLRPETLGDLFHFPPDLTRIPAPINRIDAQPLVRIYEEEIGRYTN